MVTQVEVADTEWHHLLHRIQGILSRRNLWFVSLSVLLWSILTTLLFSVVTFARSETSPHIPDPPAQYLPGSPLPRDAACFLHQNEHAPRCYVHLSDDDIYFTFDSDTGIIIKSSIPAHAYTVGQLILAWGIPSGKTGSKYILTVNWGTRSAIVYTDSLRPDTQLKFIVYETKPQPAAPWHGFRLPMG